MLSAQIFKPGDIRGVATGPDAQIDAAGAWALGAAFAEVFGLDGREFVIGHDARAGSVEFTQAFIKGADSRGAGAIQIGLSSTDELWFASGKLGLHGAQFTASHNPPGDNGVKFCLPRAKPISPESLLKLKQLALAIDAQGDATVLISEPLPVRKYEVQPDYVEYLHSLVDLNGIRPLRVVVDAGNGMSGLTAEDVLGPAVDVIGLYLDVDGTFPNHLPNPLEPENLADVRAAVRDHGADLGLAFDGDADRCVFIDEHGEPVSATAIISLIASEELSREPGAAIVVNTITSRAVTDTIAACGGRAVTAPIGHTFMKTAMVAHDAVFGGEHSAHYYFRDFWGADTGMLAALYIIAWLGHSGQTMSQLVAGLPEYAFSGEINLRVPDPRAAIRTVAALFPGMEPDYGDGLYLSAPDWWLSVRMSNTEPLLRLNVEAKDAKTMESLRERALAAIRKETR
ncbi:MAG: phosphomannomutase/phosphoglucomutase [Propionibacteriaceae bacterium]|nr:phosphomannomutase/phosphoglucomutase [Propionibacteriaceae bacterium]